MSSQNEEHGWVPANYLERRILDGPGSPTPEGNSSPPPDPFEDETGELTDLILK